MTYIGAIIGAILGFGLAKKRGGEGFDLLHYLVIFAILGALIGFVASIAILRLTAG